MWAMATRAVSPTWRWYGVPHRRRPRHDRGAPHSISSASSSTEVNYENLHLPPLRQLQSDDANAVCADEEREWLAKVVQEWLEVEYVEEPSTARIANWTADCFRTIRMDDVTDVGDLVLALALGLSGGDFSDSFRGAFEVANVSIDLLMQRYEHETVSWAATVPSMQQSPPPP